MLKTKFLIAAFLAGLPIIPAIPSYAQDKKEADKFIVVIDPGHGAHDVGTKGTGRTRTYEKHVVLSVGLKLKKLLADSFDDVKVIMTRETDRYPPFKERIDAANKNRANLFVSIHCNSVKYVKTDGPRVSGAETYVMATSRAEANLEISKRENAAMMLEENYKELYQDFDVNDPVSNISLDLQQSKHLKNSVAFATMVQNQLNITGGRKNLGVKQAVLYVTYATTVPAVLVELGFLSNPTEETFLHSEKGKNLMAQSVFEAISLYKARFYDAVKSLEDDPSPANAEVDAVLAAVLSEKPQQLDPVRPSDEKVRYCVQLTASASPLNVKTNSLLKKFSGIDFYREKNLYKYTTQAVPTYAQAEKALTDAKSKGAKDAFIIAFQGNEKISLDGARKLSGE